MRRIYRISKQTIITWSDRRNIDTYERYDRRRYMLLFIRNNLTCENFIGDLHQGNCGSGESYTGMAVAV